MSIGNSPEDDRPSAEDHLAADDHLSPEDHPAADDRLPIGRALQTARIDAGMTVDDVSAATRVRIPIIHEIEQDDFKGCGGDVYARGHIRGIARAVGIDPAPLLEQYAAEHGGVKAASPTAPMFEAERIRPEPRRPNWTAAMVAAIVAVIGFVGFTVVRGGDDGGKAQVAEGSTPTTSKPASKPTPSKGAPKPNPSDSAIAGAPRDKVTVLVSATERRSWISAKDHNGRLLFDGFLNMGESKTFQDKKRIDLVLGDAGALKLFVNGKPIEDDFQSGQVERLTYTKGDPEAG